MLPGTSPLSLAPHFGQTDCQANSAGGHLSQPALSENPVYPFSKHITAVCQSQPHIIFSHSHIMCTQTRIVSILAVNPAPDERIVALLCHLLLKSWKGIGSFSCSDLSYGRISNILQKCVLDEWVSHLECIGHELPGLADWNVFHIKVSVITQTLGHKQKQFMEKKTTHLCLLDSTVGISKGYLDSVSMWPLCGQNKNVFQKIYFHVSCQKKLWAIGCLQSNHWLLNMSIYMIQITIFLKNSTLWNWNHNL